MFYFHYEWDLFLSEVFMNRFLCALLISSSILYGCAENSAGVCANGDMGVEICSDDHSNCHEVFRWGTTDIDTADGITSDAEGNIYIVGLTGGELGGSFNAGSGDCYLTKMDKNKKILWSQQWGTVHKDTGRVVATDVSGNIYVAGTIEENDSVDYYNLFLTKLDKSGNILWTQNLGTDKSDWPVGIIPQSNGDVILTGTTRGSLDGVTLNPEGIFHAFMARYSSTGSFISVSQIPHPDGYEIENILIDSVGNLFAYGHIEIVAYEIREPYLSRFDSDHNLLWTKRWGTDSWDSVSKIVLDSQGNIYVIGGIEEVEENIGYSIDSDVYLFKMDSAGNVLWTKRWGTIAQDLGESILLDSNGFIYVQGVTRGSIDGVTPPREYDVFLSKLNDAGDLIWTRQFGTTSDDVSSGVVWDSEGNIVIGGYTLGYFKCPSPTLHDPYIIVANIN